MKHKSLNDQVIVITGATSGIGLCTALLAAERGARIVAIGRSTEVLEQLVELVRAAGGTAHAIALDVADRAEVERAASEVLALHGRIDTWVNNAGVAIYGRLDEVFEKDNRRLFETNFWGVVNGSLAALPALRASGGVLINLGSELSEAVVPLQGMYAASKHAVKGFTDALRVEQEHLDRAGVSVVLIQPGAVNTPYPQHARNYLDREPMLPTPLIAPQRVAAAILGAAERGGRDIKVGALSHMDTAAATVLPRLADRMSAVQARRQQHQQAPRHPDGILFHSSHSGQVYGLTQDGKIASHRE